MAIKSERLVEITIETGSMLMRAYLCSQGVELARLGMNDPLAFFNRLLYRMPLPYANIVADTGPTKVVMAFPVSACAQVTGGRNEGDRPRFRKPFYYRARSQQ